MTSTLRRAGDAKGTLTISTAHPCRLQRHVRCLQARHQRAASPTRRPHRVRPGLRVATHIPKNAGSLEPLTVSEPRRHDPECAQAQPPWPRACHRPRCCPTSPSLPAPGRARACAGRGHVVPVEHQRAGRVSGGGGGTTASAWHHSNGGTGARRTRTACRPPPIPAACAARRSRSPRPRRAHLLAQGVRPIGGAAVRARAGQIMESRAASTSRSTFGGVHRIDYPARAAATAAGDGQAGVVALKSGQTLKAKGFQLIRRAIA